MSTQPAPTDQQQAAQHAAWLALADAGNDAGDARLADVRAYKPHGKGKDADSDLHQHAGVMMAGPNTAMDPTLRPGFTDGADAGTDGGAA